MGKRTLSRLMRYGSLAAILAVGGYLLLAPGLPGRRPAGVAADDGGAARRARYVIKLSPGTQYFPGTRPFGIGEPLQGLAAVVRDFEARFPDTRVEVVNVPRVREYLVTQLSSEAAPDIVNVNVEDVWVDTHKGWYVPLDPFLEAPNPFVAERGDPALPGARQWWDMFRYQAISRGKAAPDGRNYCISLDMVETGVFYNRTLFDELGLAPPETWEAFLALMERIRGEGRIPLLMTLPALADWAHDLIFDQLYYDLLPGIDLTQDPAREAYLEGYLDPEELVFLFGRGFFTRQDPRYVELWRILYDLRRYVNKDLNSTDPVREFVTQRGAMLWTGSWLTYRLASDPKLGFDWGVFYLPRFTSHTSPHASGEPMCVIGGVASQFEVTNSAVGDTDPGLPFEQRIARSERLRRVLSFLQFLCLPENAERVVNEYACFVPNIVGVPVLPSLKPFEVILERRYTTTKWRYSFDLRFSDILERMLGLYLNDGIDLNEYLVWQEKNMAAAAADLVRRKEPDLEALEAAWRARAPARAGMRDLPQPERRTEP